ncbi:MAG: MATE family efflux transporter, partial [Bacteroidota bacterium]
KEFTKGSINRAIFLLSVPMILEMLMESLFAVVDVFFVAQVGVDAIATVGLTESVITLVYALAMGISMAASAMVARRIGEKNPAAASTAAAQAIIIAVGISILLGITGFLFAADILRWMGGSDELIQAGVNYTRIMFGTNIVIMLLFLLNGIFRGAGDAAIAMRSLWIANGLNIILDPFFIFGWWFFPELGLEGAAVATAIGRGVGVLYQINILLKGSSVVQLLRLHFTIRWATMRRQLQVAAGGAGQHLIASASWIFMMRIIAQFGSEAMAGYTIAIRIIVFTILPSWGMSNAAATLVGQNLGARQPERAATSVWRTAYFNMLFLIAVSVTFFAFAPELIQIFTQQASVIDAGVWSLRIICLGYPFFAYAMVLGQSFNGAGDTRTPTLANLICFWLIQIPLAYFLALHLGYGTWGVYWAIPISDTILASLLIYIFRKGNWKSVEL